MARKKIKLDSRRATRTSVEKEMAEPRIAKSARKEYTRLALQAKKA
jgi:hypothetical protein